MPNTTFTFSKSEFTKSYPSWTNTNESYGNGLRFNTVSRTLELDNENYGIGTFIVSFTTANNRFDYGSIHFSTPNGSIVASSPSKNGLYTQNNIKGLPIESPFKQEDTTLTFSGSPSTATKTYYVAINGDPDKKTSLVNVSIALATENGIPSSDIDINLEWVCPDANSNQKAYEYEVGVHAYSPYDARAGNSTLTTKLYSLVPISSWGVNTQLWSSPYLNNPALSYYYGYGSEVFRVGDPWSRSYGIKFRYEIRVTTHWFFKKRTREKRVTIGPLETQKQNGNEPTSEACIEPTMRDIGKIKRKYTGTSYTNLSQPQQYRYYLGYNSSNKYTANSGPFTDYNIPKKKQLPITGLMHVFKKFTRGLFNGFDKSKSGEFNWIIGTGPLGLSVLGLIFMDTMIAAATTGITIAFPIAGPIPPITISLGLKASTGYLLGSIFIVLAVLALVWQLFRLFKPRTHHYQEDCRLFLHHFTNTPYLSIGDTLYRDDDLNDDNAGWYSDGVYYYQQTGTAGSRTITSKQLSGINSFIGYDEDNKEIYEFKYSVPSDDPTLVEDWQKLVLLPYMSGKPLPYCGGSTIYYSDELTHTVSTQCCELEDCNTPIVISLPYGAVTSCVSQADADDEAEAQFQAAIDYAETHSVYNNTIDDSFIGQLDVNFTHTLKTEVNPTSLALFFDNRSGSDAPVGTPLYYDFTGCQKALPGYYAISGSSYPKYYYKVEDGKVDAIYTQSAASSTQTTTGESISLNSIATSNWYLKSNTRASLVGYVLNTNDRTFDVNSLLTSSPFTLSAGTLVSQSEDYDGSQFYTFSKYASFNNTGITSTTLSEQGTGWYLPLNGWKPQDDDAFFYSNKLTSFGAGYYYSTSGSSICASSHNSRQYYHDGDSSLPVVGDRIYDTNTIDDPWPYDSYIKYTSDLYMQVVDGVMVDSISCTPTSEFSGSQLTSSISGACNRSTTEVLYSHNGSSSNPAVGDTVSVYGGSTVSNGFINTSIGVLQTDSDGMIVDIIDCSTYTGLPLDMSVGLGGVMGGANEFGYANSDLHYNDNSVSGDLTATQGGFLNGTLGESLTDWRINWFVITWLGWANNNLYMVLRKTNSSSNPFFTSLTLHTDLVKTATHLGCFASDYGASNTSTNIYLDTPSGNGNDGYNNTIVSGMSVTGTGVPANTTTTGPASWSNVMFRWTVPVNNTITYNNVCGNSITFTKNNHQTSLAYRNGATITNYSNVTDLLGGTADYIVYKWSQSDNPFIQYGQNVEVNFTWSTP